MNRERLQILSDMLKRHDEIFNPLGIEFDICKWKGERRINSLKLNCDTAACALGSACLYEPLSSQGLNIVCGVPCFLEYEEYEAGEYFFNITYHQSLWLFMPSSYHGCSPTAAQVAYRVDAILNGTDEVDNTEFGL